ncbi:hypothetical protein Y032_0133g1787 [Ancylostoma ceylanicum]|nr:hypothetical protein Y032_0133g1787 [Ancylostoma ceylanicum]
MGLFMFRAMIAIALSLLVFTAAHAAPTKQVNITYAAEVFGRIETDQMQCLHKKNYKIILYEAYADGKFDDNVKATMWTAINDKMGGEVYMTPDATIEKSAQQQMDETLNGMIRHGMPITRIWIKIADEKKWSSSINYNDFFLNDLVMAAEARGRSVGIITNSKAFYRTFTGLYDFVGEDRIWYTTPEPVTCTDKKGANFDDFVPFGGWRKPSAKQYCVGENVCGITINGNIVKPGFIWIPPRDAVAHH